MKQFKFEELQIKPEGNWIRRNLWSAHAKKSLIAISIGAVAGIGYFHFTEAQNMVDVTFSEYFKSALIGGFFGFFITNSPCARGRC